MRVFGVHLINVSFSKLTYKGFGLSLALGTVGISGRRNWSLIDIMFRTGRPTWTLHVMIAGLWFSSFLKQPDVGELDDNPSDEDLKAYRKFSWGYNRFQRVNSN